MVTFSVSNYGAVFGTGQSTPVRTANKTALRNCCNAAVAAAAGGAEVEVVIAAAGFALEVYLDPATDQLTASNTLDTWSMVALLTPVGAMTIRGGGLTTHLKFFPDAPTFDYSMFYVDEFLATRNVTFKNLTIDGPPTFSGTATTYYVRYPILHQGTLTPGHHAASSITLDTVTITGKFDGGFNSNSGDITLTARNCNVSSRITAFNWFNQGNCTKYALVEDSTFSDQYVDSNNGAGLYVHPNISLEVARCSFSNISKYAVYWNDSGSVSTPMPQYAIVHDCTITSNNGIQANKLCRLSNTNDNGKRTQIYNCVIDTPDNGIAVEVFGAGDIHVYDCEIAGGNISNPWVGYTVLLERITWTGKNTFGTTYASVNAFNGTISDCTFNLTNVQNTAIAQAAPDLTDTGLLIERCHVTGTHNGLFATVGGQVTISDSTASGAGPGLYIATPNPIRIGLFNNDFSQATACIFYQLAANQIFGEGNAFPAAPINLSGGSTLAQQLRNKRGLASASVASASTVQLSAAADLVHITGTTAIDTILLGSTAGINRQFLGVYTLMFDSACSVTTAGNITPLSTAARTPGSSALFVWDTTTSKWEEQPSQHMPFSARRTAIQATFLSGHGRKTP